MESSEAPTRSGGCLCGGVAYVGRGVPGVQECHCSLCNRWCGGPFNAVLFPAGVEITKDDTLSWYASSAWAQRGFCTTCGSDLFWKSGDAMAAALGTLDDYSDLPGPMKQHIFWDQKPPAISVGDDAPKIETGPSRAMFGRSPDDA